MGKLGNAYFFDTIVAGETDFLYGFGTLWVEESTLLLRYCKGGITAWKGTNTTFENKYGVYISETQVLAANSTVGAEIKGLCALGRPWNNLDRSVFMDSYLDASITPAGYISWGGAPDGNIGPKTIEAVYNLYGPGYDEAAEKASNVTKVLDASEVRPYRYPVDVFMTEDGQPGNIQWIDRSVLFGPSS